MTLLQSAPRAPGAEAYPLVVTIELVDGNGRIVAGYVPGSPIIVVGRLQFTADGQNAYSAALGDWEVELQPNADIEPADTFYRITEQRGRSTAAIHYVTVPATGGPYTVFDALAELPGSLLSHLSQTTDVHGIADTADLVDEAALSTAVATETTRATAAEDSLSDTVAAETTRATTAEAGLSTAIAAETAARTTDVNAEEAARITAVSAEQTRATAAEAALTTSVSAETTRATTAEAGLSTAIAAETAARTTDVNAEETRALAAEAALGADIAGLETDLGHLDTAIGDEDARALAAEAALSTAAAAHVADTTGVHGIADTSQLVLTSDSRLSDQRTPLDNSVTQAKVQAGSLGIDRLAVDPRARANHSGTQPASTISDLTTAVRANRLNEMAAPNAAININGQRLTNGALPVADSDFITKAYADGLRAGLLLKADPVRVMVDTNVNISAPGAVHDGVTLSAGDSLLLTGQTFANDNGIYTYNGPAVPLTRRADADTDAGMRSGTAVWVAGGTYDDQRWALVTPDPIDLGVTNLSWAFDGGLAHVAAGDGLVKSGNELSVGEGTGLEVTADAVGIAAGGVDTTQLADDAVTADKLADNAVDTAAIADGAVLLAKLGFDVTTQAELETAVTALELVLASKLGGVHVITPPAPGETPAQQRVRAWAVRDAWAASGGVLVVEPGLYDVDGPLLYLPEDDPPGAVFSTWMIWGWGARIVARPTGIGWTPWSILDDTVPVARTYLGEPQTAIQRLISRAGRKFTVKGLELSGPGTAPGTYDGTGGSLAFITATAGAGGAITGTYRYQCTFIDDEGNETPGSAFSLRVTAAAKQINLSTIPVGPAGTTARRIYRTKAIVLTSQDGSVQGHPNLAEVAYLLATIADNTTTTYTDNNGNDASLGAQCPTIGGLRIYGCEHLLTEQCNSEFLNTDVDLIFGLLADLGGWQSYHPYNFGVRVRTAQDLVEGAAHSNSSGNVPKIRNYRCYGANNTLAHIDVIGTNEAELYGVTTEGLTPENAIRFNRDQSPNTQRFVVKLWHPEFGGGPPRDAELKIFGGPCRIVLEDTSFTTVNAVMVSVSESLGGNSVEIDRITFTAVGAKFDNGTTPSDWTIRGAGSATATIPWADPSRWVGGLLPSSLNVERWSSSGAPDYMAGTHPVNVYSKYLLWVLANLVIRTGIADPQFGVTIEGAVAQRIQNGALHPDFLGPVSGGAGAAGANYFTWTKDEALKQYRIWGKDSAGNVLAASLPYGPDSGAGAALKNGYTGLVRRTAAPADADLLASEAVPWFDNTNATPAVVWKAKSADGTVRTQRVELAGGPGAERYVSLGNLGATPTLNLASGTVQQGTLNADAAFTAFTAPPVATSYAWSFTLILRQDGTGSRTATWPAAVKWPSDTPPTLTTTAGRADVLTFFTVDGGTTWIGSLAAANIP